MFRYRIQAVIVIIIRIFMYRKSPNYQRTLVVLKPDTVQRSLIGEVIARFEKKGLKVSAMKMVWADEKIAADHYYWSDEEKTSTGTRTLEVYQEKGLELDKTPIEIAEDIQARLIRFMTTGPVVAMVVEGVHAIEWVRKMVGHGSPLKADIGTIRADFAVDSYPFADETNRVTRNLIHASSSVEEAEREIKVWFKDEEIFHYHIAAERILYSTAWEDEDQDKLKDKELK